MKNPVRNAVTLLLIMFLWGCGQTGPLYVTGNPSSIQPAGEQESAADEDEDEAAKTDGK